jgi:hypothetical protein
MGVDGVATISSIKYVGETGVELQLKDFGIIVCLSHIDEYLFRNSYECIRISLDKSKQNVSLTAPPKAGLAQLNNLEDKVRKVPSITLKRDISEWDKFKACLASK